MLAVLLLKRAVNVHAFLLGDCVGISLPRMAHVKHLILNLETLELHYVGSIHVCNVPPLDVQKSILRAVALNNIVPKQLSLPPSCDLCTEILPHILAGSGQGIGHQMTVCKGSVLCKGSSPSLCEMPARCRP
jgi:hypothetical protein